MILLGIVIGIIIMQILNLIIIYATKENEEICIIFSIFLFFPFILLLQRIIIKIKDRKRKKRLKELGGGENE